MISNDIKRQEVYSRLRKVTSDRIACELGLTADEDFLNLSLGQLINLLFLLQGHYGCLGGFSVSIAAALELVGTELIWRNPETKKAGAQFVQ